MAFTFKRKYFLVAVLLFIIEVLIAVYIRDSFVRPYGGDFLVVLLLYSVVRSFIKIPVRKAIFGVLLFSWLVEGLQYLEVLNLLGLREIKILAILLGNHFEWLDMWIYTLAGAGIYGFEKLRQKSISVKGEKAGKVN